jgi:ribulose-5-phosphate 4-epimerase/fuculose-1-phosphate aldolase
MPGSATTALRTVNPALARKLAIANRILYAQGVVDGFGHVSVRHDTDPSAFLLSCNRAPALVKQSDIVCYDFDGNTVSDTTHRPYLERFIHAEIFRARPEVMAVVHSHSASVLPFGITGTRLRPVFHMAGFLGSGASHFDIREAAGNTDLLITNSSLGKSLSDALGRHSCVMMRGHGSTVVGMTLEQAVYRAIYTEDNAKLQAASQLMGTVNFLNE